MLPTFVIGLREGVEASLVVGIVAAFLRQGGHRAALRAMWAGVGLALVLCVAVAVGLQALDEALPWQQQEALETVVATAAVGMVTFMIVWMRRHARTLAADLRTSAAAAVAQSSAWALVAMAFFAVMREGMETAVFMLAAFQASGDSRAAGLGAALGILVAAAIGFGIYRGGIRINLGRFFRVTAAILVLVAAGLVASAIHTAHEATWFNSLQATPVDLTWLVRPGTVTSSLVTGVLGVQPQPTVGEMLGWALYAVPMLAYVLAPRRVPVRLVAAAVVAALALAASACGGSKSAAGPAGSHTLNITLSDVGCTPAKLTAPAGTFRFVVQNSGSAKVTELELLNEHNIILGERENVVPGLGGAFSLTLQPGDYTLNCPNGTATPHGVLHVTGHTVAAATGPTAALLAKATAGYQSYVIGETSNLLAGTAEFVTALRAGHLRQAKLLFGPTRIHYEAIEPVAESFGSLDLEIDGRINDVASPSRWTGFHRIEQILWVRNTTAGTGVYATKLLADVTTLYHRVQTLTYQPAQLANGSVELLNEVANSKITGEEDRYSHTDLSDFQGNLQGARTAFELLAPALRHTGNRNLVHTIELRFADVERTLDIYQRPTRLGFARYGALTPKDRLALAREVDALAEPLSTVASEVSRS